MITSIQRLDSIHLGRLSRLTVLMVASLLFFAGVRYVDAQYPMSEGRAAASSERELEEHVARMRYLIAQANKRRPDRKSRDPKLALKELQEDFIGIQVVNKDLVLTTSRTENIDFKFVWKSAEEIHKRAKRLLENLALPEASSQGPQTASPIADQAHIKQSITQMGWLIYYFTKNPIFKEASVIETSSAEKARSDLEQIIELSMLIKTSSEHLGKKTDN